jgi:hypothetical protein
MPSNFMDSFSIHVHVLHCCDHYRLDMLTVIQGKYVLQCDPHEVVIRLAVV